MDNTFALPPDRFKDQEELPILSIEESRAYTQQLENESEGVTKLTICIATTKDRRLMFNVLCQELNRLIEMYGFKGKGVERWQVKIPRLNENGTQMKTEEGNDLFGLADAKFRYPNIVEWIFEEDEKQMSIGAKRQKLLDRVKSDYMVYFDSDDFPKEGYVSKIMKALESQPDCVGFKIAMTTDGAKPETCIHSLSNPEWTHDGKNYLRNVTHFNPIKTSIAKHVGFKDIRFGEDKIYSDAVSKLCKQEVFVDDYLFNYRYSTKQQHNEKYGIK